MDAQKGGFYDMMQKQGLWMKNIGIFYRSFKKHFLHHDQIIHNNDFLPTAAEFGIKWGILRVHQ